MIDPATLPIPPDAPFTVTLSLSAWQLIFRHLSVGAYIEVAPIIDDVSRQVGEQSTVIAERAEALQAEAESKAAVIN